MDITIYNQFIQPVKQYFRAYCRFDDSWNAILIACSGGPDSTVLLDLLYRLKDEYHFEIRLFHLNHGFRGEESNEDEKFVIELSNRYNIPLVVRRLDPEQIQQATESNLEEEARNYRYQKMVETAIELDCTYMATGHTKKRPI
jgi:tRNA(Ile)-lysidine synthase